MQGDCGPMPGSELTRLVARGDEVGFTSTRKRRRAGNNKHIHLPICQLIRMGIPDILQ